MDRLNYYEIVGVTLPGVIFIVGLNISMGTHLPIQLYSAPLSLGEFGIITLVSYVIGHILQSIGNLVEWVWWRIAGGWPSHWICSGRGGILTEKQRGQVKEKLAAILNISAQDIADMTSKDWTAVVSHVRTIVESAGRTSRLDSFNGTYGLLRGTAAATLVLSFLSWLVARQATHAEIWALIAVVALIRMHRFGKHYARELYLQFLQATAKPIGSNHEA